ncbi:MAG: TonB-dependent receptor plug domain-containing protein [Gammaproteobacteria bacterium]
MKLRLTIRSGMAGLMLAPTAFILPPTALAQDGEAVIEEVITIGTRRDARSADNTPAPVDVISGDELANQGDLDMSNVLRTTVPSYNVNTQPISDAATIVRPANLRGLAPDSTLVLVNGKRRHRAAVISFLGGGIADGSQGPDISVIPAIAIKQVEVLRDGAASQYGSDAIAGVINFQLRDAPEGGSVDVQWGEAYEGDGSQYRISGNIGLPLGTDGGFFNISGQLSEADATSRSVQRDDAAGLIAGGNTAVANPAQIWGQPNVNDDLTIFANSAFPFSGQAEGYAFGNYSERQVEGGFFFRNPTNRGGVFSNTGGDTLLVGDLTADGSGGCSDMIDPNDAAAVAALNNDANCFAFTELFPGGFTPRFGGDLEDASLVLGVRGELDLGTGLGYDVSYTYGQSDVSFFINNTINASLGPNTPTSFNPGAYTQTDNNINLDFNYAIPMSGLASDLNIAFGYEHRDEEFEITAGDPQSFEIGPLAAPSAAFPNGQGFSSSSNGFGGFTPASAGARSQSNDALYVDVEADITDRLILQGALRYEDFDTFGDTTNFKVGALFKATDTVRLRGTISSGFHAPTAGQSTVTNITTAFSGTTLVDQGTIPLSSPAGQFIADFIVAQGGERPTLGPEESDNFTFGVGFALGSVDVTVDYFNISVDDRISISDQADFAGALRTTADNNNVMVDDNFTTSQLINALDGAGVINAADFAGSEDLTSFGYFNNAFDTETQGIDVVATTSFEMIPGGDTTLSAAVNWTDTEVTRGTLSDGTGNLSFTRQRQLEENIPSVRGNITLNHLQGPWRGLVRMNYFGSFFECHLDAVGGDEIGTCDLPADGDAEVTFDLEGAYRFADKYEVTLGARNAFDSYPDDNPYSGIVGAEYLPTSPNGFTGGSYYLRFKADF